jgi:RNA polymerase sigma-70 factor, ECF subfamily
VTQLTLGQTAPSRRPTMGGDPMDNKDLVGRVIAAGLSRWPSLIIDAEQLARHLDKLGLRLDDVTPAIAADLFLAFACLANVPNAVQSFHKTYGPLVTATARHFDRSGGLTDELWQRLALLLFVREGERPPRIAEYRGRGPLSAWLRACAKRTALRLVRIDSLEMLVTREALAEEISDTCDQELALLKSHYGELFRVELLEALGELPARDRMLLQLNLVAGLSTTRIAKMYHRNQSSISRQLQKATASVFMLVKRRLHLRLGVATAELDSLIDLARSHIELTLSSLDEMLHDESDRK